MAVSTSTGNPQTYANIIVPFFSLFQTLFSVPRYVVAAYVMGGRKSLLSLHMKRRGRCNPYTAETGRASKGLAPVSSGRGHAGITALLGFEETARVFLEFGILEIMRFVPNV